MRVLVTWGSKRGGTEGIARTVGEALRTEGFDVEVMPPRLAAQARGFGAVIVGGALYANRWHRDARRFVTRREKDLRRVPVWFFSSGPLDESAEHQDIPPTLQVKTLMERVGALGHATFGGRLASDARGFPARAMARTHAGDWRNVRKIRAWAAEVAQALPTARPGRVIEQPGHSVARLLAHGVVGWAACAATMGALLRLSSPALALAVHAVAAPLVFAVVARHYFHARGARASMATAFGFVGIVALLDAVIVAGWFERSFAMFGSVIGTWLPLALIFAVTWATGEWVWMAPAPHGPHASGA